jgi:hypothetical protein
MNANQRIAASRGEHPDDLAANGGGCDRISLRAALMKPKITPNGLGIRGMSDKYRHAISPNGPQIIALECLTW